MRIEAGEPAKALLDLRLVDFAVPDELFDELPEATRADDFADPLE